MLHEKWEVNMAVICHTGSAHVCPMLLCTCELVSPLPDLMLTCSCNVSARAWQKGTVWKQLHATRFTPLPSHSLPSPAHPLPAIKTNFKSTGRHTPLCLTLTQFTPPQTQPNFSCHSPLQTMYGAHPNQAIWLVWTECRWPTGFADRDRNAPALRLQ